MSNAPPTPIMMRTDGNASAWRSIHRSCFGAPSPTRTIVGAAERIASTVSSSRAMERAMPSSSTATPAPATTTFSSGEGAPSRGRALGDVGRAAYERHGLGALGGQTQQHRRDLHSGPPPDRAAAPQRLHDRDARPVGEREVGRPQEVRVRGVVACAQEDLGVRREDPERAVTVEEPGRDAAELLDRRELVQADAEDDRGHEGPCVLGPREPGVQPLGAVPEPGRRLGVVALLQLRLQPLADRRGPRDHAFEAVAVAASSAPVLVDLS